MVLCPEGLFITINRRGLLFRYKRFGTIFQDYSKSSGFMVTNNNMFARLGTDYEIRNQ